MHLALVTWLLAAAPLQATPPVPMVGGETTEAHPATGALVVCSGDSCASFCSGTLVDREWVITAGHCVETLLNDYLALGVSFATGGDVRWPDGRDALVEVADAMAHPQHRTMEHDIGLVKLARPLDGVDPVVVSASPPSDSWLDTPLRYVGYGVTSDEADDAGEKRRADIPLQSWDEQWLMAEDPQGATNLCWGDSGGAAMLPLDGGGFALVGVQSWVWDDDDTPCTGGSSGAARVDAHLDWLEDEAPLRIIEIQEPEEPEDEEAEGEDQDEEERDDEEGEGEDEGETQEDQREEPGDSDLPDNSPELDGGGNPASFQRAETGCSSVPGGTPWLPALLALMLAGGPRRRRR